MFESQKEIREFSINFDREMRIVLRGGAMIYTLENKADVLLGQGK
jgi:hypothetical protein